MNWYHADYSQPDAESWVQRCVAQQLAGTDFHFAICGTPQDLIGVVSLEDVTPPEPRAMLGYWIATPAAGRGVATAAVRKVLAWAAAHTSLRLVWAHVAPSNAASRKVLEANGFRLAPAASSSSNERELTYERDLSVESAA
jgi:RimJ/RimL family protein N-acetyltransferase